MELSGLGLSRAGTGPPVHQLISGPYGEIWGVLLPGVSRSGVPCGAPDICTKKG